jgi:hypothetical protein
MGWNYIASPTKDASKYAISAKLILPLRRAFEALKFFAPLPPEAEKTLIGTANALSKKALSKKALYKRRYLMRLSLNFLTGTDAHPFHYIRSGTTRAAISLRLGYLCAPSTGQWRQIARVMSGNNAVLYSH